jgi:hypothetical protein
VGGPQPLRNPHTAGGRRAACSRVSGNSGNDQPAAWHLELSPAGKFERVGDHLHLINQAAIEGPNLKFFADTTSIVREHEPRWSRAAIVVFTNADGRISA